MTIVRFLGFLLLLCLAVGTPSRAVAAQLASPVAEPQSVRLVNGTGEDVLYLRIRQDGLSRLLRLDMPPGGSEEIDVLSGTPDVRVDTGLALWEFKAVPLDGALTLTVVYGEAPALDILRERNSHVHVAGRARDLSPEAWGRPVCALERFRPGMSMQDVCTLLKKDASLASDDNGVLRAGLGFAGMLWAARLESGQGEDAARLTRLELRRRLDSAEVGRLLSALHAQGYAPWQAEFPGLDMNFSQMPPMTPEGQQDLLDRVLRHFLTAGRGEANIMLAPADLVPSLAVTDTPRGAMQLFTVTLRPASRSLTVVVTAFDEAEAPQ